MTPAATPAPATGWQRFKAASVRAFHAYATWLVGISWKRFVLLSVLLLILSGVLQNIPPFSWSYTRVVHLPELTELPMEPPAPPKPPAAPTTTPKKPEADGGVDIHIDQRGVRITPKAAASQPSAPASAASATAEDERPVIDIKLPPGTSQAVRDAVEEARKVVEEAVQEAHQEAETAKREARQQAREAGREARRAVQEARRQVMREEVQFGESLPQLAFLWIVASLIIKITYRKQIQAEATAAQAVETAEAESLKRQVVEARMAAMQAQIEPHFLFNTLASIDHLIEVDPKRASQMQKNLIALLRASMPTMREAGGNGGGGPRDLGRELAVIRPYLEILKVRMEERLATEIDVPDGLLSAEFPTMMVQTLVENAIKHGLEPKPEGGRLGVKAEVVHGKLSVTVADTGLGFGRAATAGTGVGLANIRERLQLLYGNKASLVIAENPGGGTRATIAVPYKPLEAA
ncbi:MAG TPA: histidine kinase [Aquabacterium sp.]|mgnify:CR=1 FL=1|nr:histidine kinase [Aquabacterium sp.]HQC96113.1 histidine kinase [Aquabacterium sp.]